MMDNFYKFDEAMKRADGEYIIGFDFSLTGTGFAVFNKETGELEATGEINTSTDDGLLRERLYTINKQIESILEAYPPAVIAFEMITVSKHFLSMKKILMAFTQLYNVIERKGYKPFVIPVAIATVKSVVLDDPHANKANMLKGVFKKWGQDFESDNINDAFCVGKICQVLMDVKDFFIEEVERLGDDQDAIDDFLLDWDKGRVKHRFDEKMFSSCSTLMASNQTSNENAAGEEED